MATLDDLISDLRRLNETLPAKVASEAAPVIKTMITKQVNAGTDPYKVPWKKNQDGSKPLAGIDKYVSVRASGSTIKMVLQDPASYHQTGTSKLPKRQILPDGNALPSEWEDAIQEVVNKVSNGPINVR